MLISDCFADDYLQPGDSLKEGPPPLPFTFHILMGSLITSAAQRSGVSSLELISTKEPAGDNPDLCFNICVSALRSNALIGLLRSIDRLSPRARGPCNVVGICEWCHQEGVPLQDHRKVRLRGNKNVAQGLPSRSYTWLGTEHVPFGAHAAGSGCPSVP
ncbi:hypothetical protein BJX65DRAFT_265348 [Aspergillus insuetus]